jgi:hypothetical protein
MISLGAKTLEMVLLAVVDLVVVKLFGGVLAAIIDRIFGIFAITILVASVYVSYYHFQKTAKSIEAVYNALCKAAVPIERMFSDPHRVLTYCLVLVILGAFHKIPELIAAGIAKGQRLLGE